MATVKASDGVALYAEAHGEGVPIVLSCGYCTTHENFRPQVEPLVAAGARVILWDYRGHGRSEGPADPEAYSMQIVVDDLDRVLDQAAPGRRAVVGGFSLGGLVSLHYALEHPERVRALVLADSGPGFKDPKAKARWMEQVERIAATLESRGFERWIAGRAAETAVGRRPELPAARAAVQAIVQQDPAAVARLGRRVAGPAEGVIDELPRLSMPALVLVGEEDRAYLRAAEVMAARLPDARRVTIPGAGHVSNIEEAGAFNRAVADFLQSLPAD